MSLRKPQEDPKNWKLNQKNKKNKKPSISLKQKKPKKKTPKPGKIKR